MIRYPKSRCHPTNRSPVSSMAAARSRIRLPHASSACSQSLATPAFLRHSELRLHASACGHPPYGPCRRNAGLHCNALPRVRFHLRHRKPEWVTASPSTRESHGPPRRPRPSGNAFPAARSTRPYSRSLPLTCPRLPDSGSFVKWRLFARVDLLPRHLRNTHPEP